MNRSTPRLKTLRSGAKEWLLRTRPGWFWKYVQWRHGYLEPEMELLPRLCLRDRTSLDVGASDGAYTFLMLQFSRACVAFEPRPRAAEVLRHGYGSRLTVQEVALSDEDGTAELLLATTDVGYSTIESENALEEKMGEAASIVRLPVERQRLDSLDLHGPVGFIKIDVEGHEEAVLRGAATTLERWRPALLIEVEERHHTGAVKRVADQLAALGYQRCFYENKRLLPGDRFDIERHQNPRRPADYIRNFIFLPTERNKDFEDLRG